VVTSILVVAFPHLKKYFDKVTNKLFFRDAYDAQIFIDDLNKTLVSNSDTEVLLKKSCQLIENSIKSDFVSFYVRNTSYFKGRIIGDFKTRLSETETTELHQLLPKTHKKYFILKTNLKRS
jgi:hypothetical protein